MNKTRDLQMIRQRLEVSYSTLDIASEVEHHTRVRLSCPDSKKQYNGACPYPNCRADTNGFIVWPELTEKGCHYYCRQCGKKGDIVKLIMDIKSLKFGEACSELGIPNPYREEGDVLPRVTVKRVPRVEQWQLDELQYLNQVYPRAKLALQRERARAYLAERAIPFELAEQQGLGYVPALSEISRRTPELERFRRWCDRIVFPILTTNGERGYCGRSLFLWEIGMDEDEHKSRIDTYNAKMREQSGEKSPWHQMPRWKYTYQHAFFNLQAVKETRCPIFVEGPFDVLACLASDIQGVVSIGTNSLDVRMLPPNVYNAVMALDVDGAGCLAAKELTKGLRRKGLDVISCAPTGAKDWSSAYRLSGANGMMPIHEALEAFRVSICEGSASILPRRDESVKQKTVFLGPEMRVVPDEDGLCGVCLDLDKETPAPYERDGLMYCAEHCPQAEVAPAPQTYSPISLPSLPRKMCPCVTLGWNAKGEQIKQTCQSKVADNGFCEQHGLAHAFLEIGAKLGYPEVKIPFKWKQETLHRTIYAGVASWEEHACIVHTDRPESLKGNVEYLSRQARRGGTSASTEVQ